MQPGVTAHATLGVCLYPKPSLQQGEHIAHEFIGVENEDDNDCSRDIIDLCLLCNGRNVRTALFLLGKFASSLYA